MIIVVVVVVFVVVAAVLEGRRSYCSNKLILQVLKEVPTGIKSSKHYAQ